MSRVNQQGPHPLAPSAFARRVQRFFTERKRELPWRKDRSAYPIWISEIMLQQTRVQTVIPFFTNWIRKFPTVQALAAAPLDDVLAAWSGLGYYSRARNIHRCAVTLMESHKGRLPSQASHLRELPGIGRYTAGAIASQAFDKRSAVVDGNVARVLARFYALDVDVKSSRGQTALWSLAETLVPPRNPGDYNQGLMELGQSMCKPRTPNCAECPLRDRCRALQSNRVGELPVLPARVKKNDKPLLRTSAAFIERASRSQPVLLLGNRPTTGLYGGLWELPAAPTTAELQTALPGLAIVGDEPLMIRHQELSHRRLRIDVWAATLARKPRSALDYTQLAWHPVASLADLGVSTPTSAIVAALGQ